MVLTVKVIKESSHDIVKLLINQVGITVFSIVLYTAVNAIDDEALLGKITVIISVFATVFYFALIYAAAWDFGARDKIRIDSGNLERTQAKGALISFIANIPNFLLAFLAVISILVFISCGSDGAYSAFSVINFLLGRTNAMFFGAIHGIFASLKSNNEIYLLCQSVAYFIAPIFTVTVTHLGYELGLREFRIFKLPLPRSPRRKK